MCGSVRVQEVKKPDRIDGNLAGNVVVSRGDVCLKDWSSELVEGRRSLLPESQGGFMEQCWMGFSALCHSRIYLWKRPAVTSTCCALLSSLQGRPKLNLASGYYHLFVQA